MHEQRLALVANDGYELSGTLFHPAEERWNGEVILLAGAIGVEQSFYKDYAAFLAGEGFTVVTFDYRGIGASLRGPLRDVRANLLDWGERDIAAVIAWISSEYPEAKLLYVAHSAGGQLLGLARNNDRVAAMLMISAPSGYWRLWKGKQRLFIGLLWFVLMPVMTRLVGHFPGRRMGLGVDLPPGVALNWARWGRNPHYISDEQGRPIREHYRSFSAPIRAYSFSDDSYAPREAVAELLSYYSDAPTEHEHLRPQDIGVRSIGHLRFFKDTFRDSLWRRTSEWLRSQ